MKLDPRLIVVAIVLALGGCYYPPIPASYTESESPKALRLDDASTHVAVRFAPGSDRLLAGDAARLRALAATGGITPSDRVSVAVGGNPALAAARFDTISHELLRYQIVASPQALGSVAPNQAIIQTGRYLVSYPRCHDWSKHAWVGFTNTASSNWGCADAVNLGKMVASPADLVEGRPVAMADGMPAAAAVNRYLTDKVQLPTAATLGPISSPSSAAPGGAGASGSTP
jgi:pilus assembly protein CpaD